MSQYNIPGIFCCRIISHRTHSSTAVHAVVPVQATPRDPAMSFELRQNLDLQAVRVLKRRGLTALETFSLPRFNPSVAHFLFVCQSLCYFVPGRTPCFSGLFTRMIYTCKVACFNARPRSSGALMWGVRSNLNRPQMLPILGRKANNVQKTL